MYNKNALFSLIVLLLLLTPMEGLTMTNIFFSHPDCQKEIIVKPLLLNKSDVIKLLNGEELTTNSEIFKNDINDINLVARVKNTGNKGAWGILVCSLEGRDVKISITGLPSNGTQYVNFIIPVDILPPSLTKRALSIEVKWEKLYCK